MLRLTASMLAAAVLSGTVLATTDPLGCAEKADADQCKGIKGCKWAKKLEVCYNKSLGEPEEQTPAPETTNPTAEPTESPTEAPTEAPTEEPTEAPVEPPTEAPEEPTGPFVQAACAAIDLKSKCNRTPTCVYKNLEESCAGCSDLDTRNSCERTTGCKWRHQACKADETIPHANDDDCMSNLSKRHCRRVSGCQWSRNGKCTGHRGCDWHRHSIDCRGAFACFWLPKKNECIDISAEHE